MEDIESRYSLLKLVNSLLSGGNIVIASEQDKDSQLTVEQQQQLYLSTELRYGMAHIFSVDAENIQA